MNDYVGTHHLLKKPKSIKSGLPNKILKLITSFSLYLTVTGVVLVVIEKEKAVASMFVFLGLAHVFNMFNAR